MKIGQVKSEFEHQGTLEVSLVGNENPKSITLCKRESGLSFAFYIHPDEIEHFIDLLRAASVQRFIEARKAGVQA